MSKMPLQVIGRLRDKRFAAENKWSPISQGRRNSRVFPVLQKRWSTVRAKVRKTVAKDN